jgi:hypothetical protein
MFLRETQNQVVIYRTFLFTFDYKTYLRQNLRNPGSTVTFFLNKMDRRRKLTTIPLIMMRS